MVCVAYTDERYVTVARKAVGEAALVLVSPPCDGVAFARQRAAVQAAHFVYFNFHAVPGAMEWRNTHGDVALNVDALRGLNLSRAVVFMVNCYVGGGGMLDAIRHTSPRAIIGGEGENLGGLDRLAGADLLALWVRRLLALGLAPNASLGLAKRRLRVGAQTASVRDALEFKIL